MDVETPDDDLMTSWAVPLDEPDPVPAETPPPLPELVAVTPTSPEPEAPRLTLRSREVPTLEFQPRLFGDR